MNRVECNICGEIVEVTGRSVAFPYECSACLGGEIPCQSALGGRASVCCFDPPCQSSIDMHDTLDAHDADILDQFDADTELINGLMAENEDLKMQLSQANLDVQIQGEIIDDLDKTINALRVTRRGYSPW